MIIFNLSNLSTRSPSHNTQKITRLAGGLQFEIESCESLVLILYFDIDNHLILLAWRACYSNDDLLGKKTWFLNTKGLYKEILGKNCK